MNIPLYNQYQDFTDTTAIYPLDRAIEYVGLAIGDEIGELIEKLLPFASFQPESAPKIANIGDDVAKESGDAMYYVARMARHFDVTLAEIFERARYDGPATLVGTMMSLSIYGSKIQGRVKKLIRDGQKWTESEVYENEGMILAQLGNIVGALTSINRYFGTTIEHVLYLNRKKLESRKERGVLSGSGDNR